MSNTAIAQKLLRFQGDIDRSKESRIRAEAAFEAAETQFEELDTDGPDEAQQELDKLNKSLERQGRKLETRLTAIGEAIEAGNPL